MHGMHARLPKNFVLEERLERYAQVIELEPARYAGLWAEACHPLGRSGACRYDRVHVDLGCGKGAFVVQMAASHPRTLFVAVDAEPICIAYTAQHVVEAGLANVVVVPALGDHVAHMFARAEVDALTINFPTPFPRKKEAGKRLVILERLLEYREVLAPDAHLLIKTDSYPLWRFAQTQLDLAGYRMTWCTSDARSERPHDVATEYEQRLSAQGATVYAIEAAPGPAPASTRQTASLSLVDYLPTDLAAMDYVPHGMQGTVTNLRNRKLREEMRA